MQLVEHVPFKSVFILRNKFNNNWAGLYIKHICEAAFHVISHFTYYRYSTCVFVTFYMWKIILQTLIYYMWNVTFHVWKYEFNTYLYVCMYVICTKKKEGTEKLIPSLWFLPFLRTTSSDSGLRVTDTTFISSRLPPCRIKDTTCLWPTFTTFTPFT